MSVYKTEAVILSRVNFGEADKLLTLFSKHYGKLKALAKGVRRVSSRKGGSLELFNHVGLVLARGKNLDIITEVDLKNSFRIWRKDLIRVGLAYYLVELVDKLTAEGQKNQQVFFLLKRVLAGLEGKDLVSLVRQFEEAVLKELGFGVPTGLRAKKGSLSDYIEEIIERKLKSKEVLRKIKYGQSA